MKFKREVFGSTEAGQIEKSNCCQFCADRLLEPGEHSAESLWLTTIVAHREPEILFKITQERSVQFCETDSQGEYYVKRETQ